MINNNSRILIEKYLELMKGALLHSLYEENFYIIRKSYGKNTIKKFTKNLIINFLNKNSLALIRFRKRDKMEILEGRSWPNFALTMIGKKRLDNIQYCAEEIIKNNIEGDFIEAGVWR